MNKISNNILAFLSGLGLILFPQTALAEEESNSSDEGSAAGSAPQFSSRRSGAGTIAAVVAIRQLQQLFLIADQVEEQ